MVVVGSGYGGAIAASRMARAGRRVCLLERGQELQPGEYPDAMTEALAELQVDSKEGHLGKPTALYDFRRNDDMNVFQGCGLGGTSLVNANVAIPAEDRVFDDERWPEPLRGRPSVLDDGYRRAREMLRPEPFPDEFPQLKKLEALKTAGAYLESDFYRPPIAVNFREGVNHVGVHQPACPLVGDCVTGCNYGAKNTTLMNYLPDARNHGAEIYTEVSVRRLERREGGWLVHYDVLEAGREKFDAPQLFVRADVVILGAGSLGSTEILLRSAEQGLPLSQHVGERFTGNGDVLGFGYNCDEPILGIGFGDHAVGELPPVGPCITGIVDMREQPELDSGKLVASTTLDSVEEWQNSTLIEGNVAEALSRLKQEDGKNILVNGSPTLVRSLLRDNLLDELRLFVHPVVVGSNERLFEAGGDQVALKLADSYAYANGVVSLTYEPADS